LSLSSGLCAFSARDGRHRRRLVEGDGVGRHQRLRLGQAGELPDRHLAALGLEVPHGTVEGAASGAGAELRLQLGAGEVAGLDALAQPLDLPGDFVELLAEAAVRYAFAAAAHAVLVDLHHQDLGRPLAGARDAEPSADVPRFFADDEAARSHGMLPLPPLAGEGWGEGG